jgi:hypothetical protein
MYLSYSSVHYSFTKGLPLSKGNILISGFTNQHIGKNTRLKYDPVAQLFARTIEKAGYTIEHRAVEPEEDLTKFDLIFMGVSSLSSITAGYSYGALWAIGEAKKHNLPMLFFIDDWKMHGIQGNAVGLLNKPETITKDFFKGRHHYDWAVENVDLVKAGLEVLATDWFDVVMPLYKNGDHDLFKPKMPEGTNIIAIDPTDFYTDYGIPHTLAVDKKDQWVFGILSDQQKWLEKLDLGWPLAHRGSKASKAEAGGMPESELVQMYADSWGVLSCPYWHAGSGWLRIRHDHAALTGSILVSQSKELSFISPAYDVTVKEVEAMSLEEKMETANAQARAWYSNKTSQTEAAQQMDLAIQAEIEGKK